jgi:23S rRNA U2552 (ribose-2'-O)-methylase RlmE/FtsJ
MTISLPGVFTYKQDVTDQVAVKKILQENGIEKIDLIQSDMAPNTT